MLEPGPGGQRSSAQCKRTHQAAVAAASKALLLYLFIYTTCKNLIESQGDEFRGLVCVCQGSSSSRINLMQSVFQKNTQEGDDGSEYTVHDPASSVGQF